MSLSLSLSLHIKILNTNRKAHRIVTHTTIFLAIEKDSHPIAIEVFVGEEIYNTYVSFERGYSEFKIILLTQLFLQPQFSPYGEHSLSHS
jgi:hypothetical protein